MPFQPGQSGNPGGRARVVLPDGRTITDIARDHTITAIDALAKVASQGESEAARVSAASALLDRGWGRPKQEIAAAVELPAITATERSIRLASLIHQFSKAEED